MGLLTRHLGGGLAAAVLALAWSAGAQAAERIGVAAAVGGTVVKTSGPGRVGKRLRSGMPIHAGERITTGPAGRLQILLLDESVFTMGPRSSMVMDEFVYDPGRTEGSVVARFVSGLFRFVTGKVAARNPRNMSIKASVIATIGIRGTTGVVEVIPPPGAEAGLPTGGLQHVAATGSGVVMHADHTDGIVRAALTGPGFDSRVASRGAIIIGGPNGINGDGLLIANSGMGVEMSPGGQPLTFPGGDFISRVNGVLGTPGVPAPAGGGALRQAAGSGATQIDAAIDGTLNFMANAGLDQEADRMRTLLAQQVRSTGAIMEFEELRAIQTGILQISPVETPLVCATCLPGDHYFLDMSIDLGGRSFNISELNAQYSFGNSQGSPVNFLSDVSISYATSQGPAVVRHDFSAVDGAVTGSLNMSVLSSSQSQPRSPDALLHALDFTDTGPIDPGSAAGTNTQPLSGGE